MIDLSDFLTSFQYEISPPGSDLYPNMTDDEAVQRLIDSFGELRLFGLDFLSAFTCDDNGIISPQSSGVGATTYIPVYWYTDDGLPDLGREVIQAIILFAGYRVVLTAYQNVKTSTSAKAGSVSFEAQSSAQVLITVLKSLTAKLDMVLTRLSDLGATTVTVLDAVMDSTTNIAQGENWFVRGSFGDSGGRGGW